MMEDFSANASALGYFYQSRYALFLLLSRAEADAELYVERLDDVSFEQGENPVEVLQARHQIKATASLSDASTALWKTLRRWSLAIAEARVRPGETILALTTTGRAPKDSAASKLRPHATRDRDPQTALKILSEVASKSESQTNRPAYEAFRKLSDRQQRALVESIQLLDSSPNIQDTRDRILDQLRISARPQFLEAIYGRVEGWWFNRLIQHLSSDASSPISTRELLDQINDLQEHHHADNLPIGFPDAIAQAFNLIKNTVTSWETRRTESAQLLNPAFCGELLRRSIRTHNAVSPRLIPFPLLFLTLPIVLHRQTRESISATTKEQMHVWLQNHQSMRIGFADRARDLVPITREAIAFLLQIGAIAVDDRAGIRLTRYVARNVPVSPEITDCYKKAEILGRWFARAGAPAAIYTMWGVKP